MSNNISFGGNFASMAKRFAEAGHKRLQTATAVGLTNVAYAAREAVQAEMKTVFRDPTRFTLSSVRVQRAEASRPIADQFSRVYLKDDYPKTNTSPAAYLLPQELGGPRGNKRSENVLKHASLILPGEQTTPADLPIKGPQMVRILSGVKAFGQVGFDANATSRTTSRLRARKTLVTRATGTPYFLAKSKLGEGYMGIFQLVAPGQVKPVLWFDLHRPNYKPIFHFLKIVEETAKARFVSEIEKALTKAIEGLK